MKKKDLKILKITFSGLTAILFYISGLWIVSAFFALLSLYFMDQKEWDNEYNTILTINICCLGLFYALFIYWFMVGFELHKLQGEVYACHW